MNQAANPNRFDYLRQGDEIYRRSFAIIRAEADLSQFSPEEEEVAVRMIHACGMVEITSDLVFSQGAVAKAHQALRQGAPVLCDSQMLAHGIITSRLPRGNAVICKLGDPEAHALAQKLGTTRSAAAAELWRDKLDGSLVAVGNAPTVLFHLLSMLDDFPARPACIIGMPVGFVGAAEAKEGLIADGRAPFITIRGRRGGSAMAAAAVNAIAAHAQ
jgi:precorrin-8X/cobalt-precorrin-8 methylmutase